MGLCINMSSSVLYKPNTQENFLNSRQWWKSVRQIVVCFHTYHWGLVSFVKTSCESCCPYVCMSVSCTNNVVFFISPSLFGTTNHMHDISSIISSWEIMKRGTCDNSDTLVPLTVTGMSPWISLTGCIGSNIDDLALGPVDLMLVRGWELGLHHYGVLRPGLERQDEMTWLKLFFFPLCGSARRVHISYHPAVGAAGVLPVKLGYVLKRSVVGEKNNNCIRQNKRPKIAFQLRKDIELQFDGFQFISVFIRPVGLKTVRLWSSSKWSWFMIWLVYKADTTSITSATLQPFPGSINWWIWYWCDEDTQCAEVVQMKAVKQETSTTNHQV